MGRNSVTNIAPDETPDAAELLAEVEAILACVPDGVLVYDADGRIVRSNSAADAILRYGPEERRLPIAERLARVRIAWFREDGRALALDELPALRAARLGETHRGVVLRMRGPDQERWVSMSAAPLVVRGKRVGAVVTITDDTAQERAEEALREANERLRDADRRKDEFLGMLSHELRNPLAPIRNALFILDHAEPTGQQARRAKEIAGRQVGHLTRLVDDLLDVTRIARGKIELRRADLDLSALARRTADDYRALMKDRGLDLALEAHDAPVVVNGDETRLSQVLGNLLSNAAKFTPAGGRVTLAVARERRRAVMHVRDTGPGIAPDVLPTLFEPFTQGKQTLARSEGGLGLGLALVKGLVALHGGEVAVASGDPGAGSDFVVTLPLVEPRARAADAGARASAAA